MDYKITGYEPAKLFHYFEEISAIPRESGNEKQISDYLVTFAKDHGLWQREADQRLPGDVRQGPRPVGLSG